LPRGWAGRGFWFGWGRGFGNPYPFCRWFPWLPRWWWTYPYYWMMWMPPYGAVYPPAPYTLPLYRPYY